MRLALSLLAALLCHLIALNDVQALSVNHIGLRLRSDTDGYTGSSKGVGNDTCHVDAAAKYVRAVITHTKQDAHAIPTTEDVHRKEGPPSFQITTASNRKELLTSSVIGPQAIFGGPLYEDRQPTYSIINATTVQVNYTIVAGLLNGTLPLTTARIEEYFTFPSPQSCLIDYILAIFYIGQK